MEKESPFGSLDNRKPEVDFGRKPPVVFSKLFLDGSIGAGTAAMYGGRKDEEIKKLLHDRKSLKKIIDEVQERGLIPMMHAIGGRAVDLSIKSISSWEKPSRIEHAIEIGDRSLNQARRKGIYFCMQPNFAYRWGRPGGMYEKAVGQTFKRLNRIRTVYKRRIPLCFGTDMMPPDPLYALEGAVNNPIISERISLAEAVRCYTTNSANLSLIGDGNDFSLRVGGNGDIVVFGRDKVYATVVQGRLLKNGQCIQD